MRNKQEHREPAVGRRTSQSYSFSDKTQRVKHRLAKLGFEGSLLAPGLNAVFGVFLAIVSAEAFGLEFGMWLTALLMICLGRHILIVGNIESLNQETISEERLDRLEQQYFFCSLFTGLLWAIFPLLIMPLTYTNVLIFVLGMAALSSGSSVNQAPFPRASFVYTMSLLTPTAILLSFILPEYGVVMALLTFFYASFVFYGSVQSYKNYLQSFQLMEENLKLVQEIQDQNTIVREANSRMESALSAANLANEEKSKFVANMSHELRTPLNGILGMVTVGLEAHSDGEREKSLEYIYESAQHLRGLISDVLDFSRIEAGKFSLETELVEVKQVFERALQMVEPIGAKRGVRVKTDIDPGLPKVLRIDPVRLTQVMVNLLGNAIKFSPEGAQIEFSSKVLTKDEHGCSFQFSVRDFGVGIPSDRRDQIFAEFTQLDNSLARSHGGTGLGLTISKNLVHLMGGTIAVESSDGEGSCFIVELAAPYGEVIEPSIEGGKGLNSLRILLAEDNEINITVLENLLTNRGHIVEVARDGAEAVRVYSSGQFDVILMDLQMPVLDGLGATRQIREIEVSRGVRKTPIVAITAHATAEHREECLRSGMDGFVTKPISLPSLLAVFSELMITSTHE